MTLIDQEPPSSHFHFHFPLNKIWRQSNWSHFVIITVLMIHRRKKKSVIKIMMEKCRRFFLQFLRTIREKWLKRDLSFVNWSATCADYLCRFITHHVRSERLSKKFALPFCTTDDKSNSITWVSIIRLIRSPILSTNECLLSHVESLLAFWTDKCSFFLRYIPPAIFRCFKFSSLSMLFKNLFSGKCSRHICVWQLDTCKRTKNTKNHIAWPIMTL